MADNRGLCDKNTQMISCGRFTGFYVILTGTGGKKTNPTGIVGVVTP